MHRVSGSGLDSMTGSVSSNHPDQKVHVVVYVSTIYIDHYIDQGAENGLEVQMPSSGEGTYSDSG
jgi:hypothetical protein